jgi:single-strand DNA-binding protein
MNSFTLTAVGNLARNPEAVAKGDITFTRFCLVGNDYAGKDDEGASREIVTTLWFVAFGSLADSLVRYTRKGDQLIVEARVRSNNWTDKQGEKQYDHEFVVQGFRYGAPGKIKREEREARREEGAQRGEGRANGRDHGAPTIAGSGGSSAGSQSNSTTESDGTDSHVSAGSNGNASGDNGADSASALTPSDNTTSGNTASGITAGGNAASGNASGSRRNSGAGASTGEKASGPRSGRRAAVSPP